VLGATGALLLALVVAVLVWPWLVLGPSVAFGTWIGIATIVRAFRIRGRSASVHVGSTGDERTRQA
jgi:hypothetical protein